MEEYFDVLNEKGEYIGKTETRKNVIKKVYGIKQLWYL